MMVSDSRRFRSRRRGVDRRLFLKEDEEQRTFRERKWMTRRSQAVEDRENQAAQFELDWAHLKDVVRKDKEQELRKRWANMTLQEQGAVKLLRKQEKIRLAHRRRIQHMFGGPKHGASDAITPWQMGMLEMFQKTSDSNFDEGCIERNEDEELSSEDNPDKHLDIVEENGGYNPYWSPAETDNPKIPRKQFLYKSGEPMIQELLASARPQLLIAGRNLRTRTITANSVAPQYITNERADMCHSAQHAHLLANALVLQRRLGKGGFGTAYLVQTTEPRRTKPTTTVQQHRFYAVKVLEDQDKLWELKGVNWPEDCKLQDRSPEYRVYRDYLYDGGAHHPNICQLHAFAAPDDQHALLYFQFCDGGDLDHLLDDFFIRKEHLPEAFLWHLFVGLSSAVRYLHTGEQDPQLCLHESSRGEQRRQSEPPDTSDYAHWRPVRRPTYVQRGHSRRAWIPVVHNDINPRNVFLRWREDDPDHVGYPDVKLGDFGLSFGKNAWKIRSRYGTPEFGPPTNSAGVESDVWAMGATIHAAAHLGLPPLRLRHQDEERAAAVRNGQQPEGRWWRMFGESRVTIPNNVNDSRLPSTPGFLISSESEESSSEEQAPRRKGTKRVKIVTPPSDSSSSASTAHTTPVMRPTETNEQESSSQLPPTDSSPESDVSSLGPPPRIPSRANNTRLSKTNFFDVLEGDQPQAWPVQQYMWEARPEWVDGNRHWMERVHSNIAEGSRTDYVPSDYRMHPLPAHYSATLDAMVEWVLNPDAAARPTAAETAERVVAAERQGNRIADGFRRLPDWYRERRVQARSINIAQAGGGKGRQLSAPLQASGEMQF